jgi:hypothetical protein
LVVIALAIALRRAELFVLTVSVLVLALLLPGLLLQPAVYRLWYPAAERLLTKRKAE